MGSAWDGMLSERQCSRCGKKLNEDGNHPAELYAGTYTGLCYKCEKAPAYVVKTYVLDGAQMISYPPHCPGWRRDRETYTAYPDCKECGGKGSHWIYRSDGQGGDYRTYCKTCIDRFSNHPSRVRHQNRMGWLRRAAQNTYESALKKAKLYNRMKKGETIPAEDLIPIHDPLVKRYKSAKARMEERGRFLNLFE